MGEVIYCDSFAKSVKEYIKSEVKNFSPVLAIVNVGNNPASEAYIRGKKKDCIECGIVPKVYHYDEISEEELTELIIKLNLDDSVNGIIVQLPLPKNINAQKISNLIFENKDVDGFGKNNVSNLYTGRNCIYPCTPLGVIRILEYLGYNDLTGLHAVVVGRSNIVGKPAAQMLLNKNATVTVCHSKTKNLKEYTKTADILVSAVGKPKFIKNDFVKDNAIILDIGINRMENGKLCGDVDLEDVLDKVKYITPVPKGMGLVTRAMLLENTLECFKRQNFYTAAKK